VSEKIVKKLAVSILLLLMAPILTLLGINGRIETLEQQLAQAREELDREFRSKESLRTLLNQERAKTAQARALLQELVNVTSVTFGEYGEQMPYSETALHKAQRAERYANLMKAIRAFLAQAESSG
jgi:Mg2+/Co2+ transporter CorB